MAIETQATLEDVETFRSRARAWLAENMPKRGADFTGDIHSAEDVEHMRELQRTLFDGGFAGICYPSDCGGQGLTAAHQRAFDEESMGYEMPVWLNIPTFTIIGPTIVDFGTVEQKHRYVPAFLRGDEIWVQFLSEPSNGSDLAGAITRATAAGDGWVLNGSKIWSSNAHHADWAMCLARTNWDVPKHEGLTMFLLKVRQPGVQIEPITMVDGEAHFSQEFFDDVAMPPDTVLGEVDGGWEVARRLLAHERTAVGGGSIYSSGRVASDKSSGVGTLRTDLIELGGELGRSSDPVTRQLVAEAHVLDTAQGQLVQRVSSAIRAGKMPPAASAVLKLYSGTATARRLAIAIEIAGPEAVSTSDDRKAAKYGMEFLMRQSIAIGGGTNEIQRNIISERVLEMPREYSADRGKPFNEVRQNTVTTRKE
jgi:alkylation response protein AidB-like acyl-CoA dehydrogenase